MLPPSKCQNIDDKNVRRPTEWQFQCLIFLRLQLGTFPNENNAITKAPAAPLATVRENASSERAHFLYQGMNKLALCK